ncbi:hypothetical protein GOP47_0030293 [Adiantum capillus-veneris]|nr:hypothetical protein GOP47_0030293 [Adiantum capillus-veneris]
MDGQENSRRGAAGAFDTMNLGAGPQRVPQFDTINLGDMPVREQAPSAAPSEKVTYGMNGAAGGGGETPINPAPLAAGERQRMPQWLLLTSLCLRAAAMLSLIISVAVLGANSLIISGFGFISLTSFSSTK